VILHPNAVGIPDATDVVETDAEDPRARGSDAVLANAALEETDVGRADEENGVPGIWYTLKELIDQ